MAHKSTSHLSGLLSPLRVAAIYGFFGMVWILFSDMLLHSVVRNPELEAQIQTGKGWFFILVTASLVYVLTARLVSSIKTAHTRLQDMNETLERRVVERTAELSANETYVQAVVNHSAEAIITLNAQGCIETFNPQAQAIFGYTEDEMMGKAISTLIPQNSTPLNNRLDGVDHFVETLIDKPRDLVGQRKNGGAFPVKLNVSRMELDGETKFIGILRDITERKTIEDALRDAKNSAEEANHAKSEFLSSMSHELRTPLNAIIGFSDSLMHGTFGPMNNPDHEEYIGHIKTSGQHLLELINDVLDLAKVEAGKVDLHFEDISPCSLVADCLELLDGPVQERRIQIEKTDTLTVDIKVRADKIRLKQVLLNLMSNGVKYNSQGGRLTISCAYPHPDILRIGVTDTGPGIAPEDHDELFIPFHRLAAEHSTVQGTGIGLTVSKKLVELMGGDIGFESTVGQGSTFWVDLPYAD